MTACWIRHYDENALEQRKVSQEVMKDENFPSQREDDDANTCSRTRAQISRVLRKQPSTAFACFEVENGNV